MARNFFAPALADENMIANLWEKLVLPANIIALPYVPPNTKLAYPGDASITMARVRTIK